MNTDEKINGHELPSKVRAPDATVEPPPSSLARDLGFKETPREVTRWAMDVAEFEWPNEMASMKLRVKEPAIFQKVYARAREVQESVTIALAGQPTTNKRTLVTVYVVFLVSPDAPDAEVDLIAMPDSQMLGIANGNEGVDVLDVVVNPVTGRPLMLWEVAASGKTVRVVQGDSTVPSEEPTS